MSTKYNACPTCGNPKRDKAILCRPCRVASFNPDHGTTAKYGSGCRCDACREARAAYKRGLRVAADPKPPRIRKPRPRVINTHDAAYWRNRALDAEATARMVQNENARLVHQMTQRVPA